VRPHAPRPSPRPREGAAGGRATGSPQAAARGTADHFPGATAPAGPAAGGRGGSESPRQAPPPQRVTFHFGEGQDRAVAGAERGHPGRMLLHDEPAACRSAAADRLHPGAGRGGAASSSPLGPCPPGLSPAPVAAAHCGGRPAAAAHILPARRAALHTRALSLLLPGAANSNVTLKCTPHAHPRGSPAPPPPGTSPLAPSQVLPAASVPCQRSHRTRGLGRDPGDEVCDLGRQPPPFCTARNHFTGTVGEGKALLSLHLHLGARGILFCLSPPPRPHLPTPSAALFGAENVKSTEAK
jgi:hypothetical protein